MPISDQKLAANRANAAKSTGSKTPRGKRNSSRNALKHGFLAKCMLVGEESPDAFHQLHRSIASQFQPETPYEHALVETMTVARWRQFRLWHIESASIRHEQDRQIAGNTVNGSEQPCLLALKAEKALKTEKLQKQSHQPVENEQHNPEIPPAKEPNEA